MRNYLIWVTFFLSSISLDALALIVEVVDIQGEPVANAVVELKNPDYILRHDGSAVMDQVNKQFMPHILTIQQGTKVFFPNSDSIKHHVYSFSSAKPFQLRLYKDRLPEPLTFEKSGVVALGCNIHDWMSGYIYVAQSDLYGRTNEQGQVEIDAPVNAYQLHIWHPRMNAKDIERTVNINTRITTSTRFQLLQPLHRIIESSADEFDAY